MGKYISYNGTGNDKTFQDYIEELKKMGLTEHNNYSSSPHGGYSYDCCKNCPNNPLNNPHASGICHCVLPSMEQVRY